MYIIYPIHKLKIQFGAVTLRILITTEFYLPLICGVTTAVLNQKKALEEKGHEVRILTINDENRSYFKDNVYYVRSNLAKLYKDSNATTAFNDSILKDVYAWNPDVVHAQCEFFTMIFAKKIAKHCQTPLILTSHTDFDSYGVHFMKNQKLWCWITRTFIPKLIKKADFIICPTNKNFDILKGYGVKNDMKIIPVGLDLEHLKQQLTEEERKTMRSSYGFTDDNIVVVSVCRLSEEKNVTESIDHFKSLYAKRPDCRMLIVGDGTTKTALEEKVEKLNLTDAIKFTGSIEMNDVWKFYKLGDIFISSSLSEIQGLTYIEALSTSLPIICRKDDALKMSLIYGVNGYDFITDEEFMERILPLVDDKEERLKMGRQALESVEKYSIPHFGESLLEVYDKILKKDYHYRK